MVESKPVHCFEFMVTNKRGLCQIALFPFMDPKGLLRFSQINKACKLLLDPRSKYCVNFEMLFKAWGINLTPHEVKNTLKSTILALKMAMQYLREWILNKSEQIVPKRCAGVVRNTVSIPFALNKKKLSYEEVKELGKDSLEKAFFFEQLSISKVKWNDIYTLGFTLKNGQTVRAGTRNFTNSYTFNPKKKITRVETIINIYENGIIQINFFHQPSTHSWESEREEERLVSVGKSDDHVRNDGGRVVNF